MNLVQAKDQLKRDGFVVDDLLSRPLYTRNIDESYTEVVIERLVKVVFERTVFPFRFYGIKWEGIVADMNYYHHSFKQSLVEEKEEA